MPKVITPQDIILAMNQSVELWEWIVKTGNRNKCGFEGSFNLNLMSAHCPLCELTDEFSDCKDCPMYDHWPSDYESHNVRTCMNGSVFVDWTDEVDGADQKVLDGLKRRLKELLKEYRCDDCDGPECEECGGIG